MHETLSALSRYHKQSICIYVIGSAQFSCNCPHQYNHIKYMEVILFTQKQQQNITNILITLHMIKFSIISAVYHYIKKNTD